MPTDTTFEAQYLHNYVAWYEIVGIQNHGQWHALISDWVSQVQLANRIRHAVNFGKPTLTMRQTLSKSTRRPTNIALYSGTLWSIDTWYFEQRFWNTMAIEWRTINTLEWSKSLRNVCGVVTIRSLVTRWLCASCRLRRVCWHEMTFATALTVLHLGCYCRWKGINVHVDVDQDTEFWNWYLTMLATAQNPWICKKNKRAHVASVQSIDDFKRWHNRSHLRKFITTRKVHFDLFFSGASCM